MFNNPDSGRMANNAPTMPQLAAYAASHPFPTTEPSDHLRAAAIVNRSNGTIKIYNFSDRPIRDADIWVNKAFVQHVSGIAPNSSVVMPMNQLYDGLGQNFATVNAHVNTVQLQMSNEFYNLEGPASD
jgi:hypothetical protein